MTKYYAFLLVIVGIALSYAFIKDPCNQQLSADFFDRYPDYEILNSGASEGSPESVKCNISYRKGDSEQVYEDTWLYQHSRSGWEFTKVLNTRRIEPTDGIRDNRSPTGDQQASTRDAERPPQI